MDVFGYIEYTIKTYFYFFIFTLKMCAIQLKIIYMRDIFLLERAFKNIV